MSYQMTIHLSDQEYALLVAEAARSGKRPEMLTCGWRGCCVAGSGPADRPIVRAVIGVDAAAVPAVACVGD